MFSIMIIVILMIILIIVVICATFNTYAFVSGSYHAHDVFTCATTRIRRLCKTLIMWGTSQCSLVKILDVCASPRSTSPLSISKQPISIDFLKHTSQRMHSAEISKSIRMLMMCSREPCMVNVKVNLRSIWGQFGGQFEDMLDLVILTSWGASWGRRDPPPTPLDNIRHNSLVAEVCASHFWGQRIGEQLQSSEFDHYDLYCRAAWGGRVMPPSCASSWNLFPRELWSSVQGSGVQNTLILSSGVGGGHADFWRPL